MLWHSLVLLLALYGAQAKDRSPKVHKTKFDFQITDIRYFEKSETVIAHSLRDGSLRISYDGGTEWDTAEGIGDDQVVSVWFHPMDSKRAYAVGGGRQHYYTKDQGKSWSSFTLDQEEDMRPTEQPPFSFHADDPDKVILNAHSRLCFGPVCQFRSFYTTDGFKTVNLLRDKSKDCLFARATPNLAKNGANADLALCLVEENFELFSEGQRVLMSDDYFKTELKPKLDGRNDIKSIISMAAVKGYIVAAQNSIGTSEVALFVTDDGEQWDSAEFPQKLEKEAYTILESTDYSIQLGVMTNGPFNSMGSIFSSNSNGTYFRENVEHVNLNEYHFVDFEKVAGIQGIYLVNTVDNWEEVANSALAPKKLTTQITFDDGRTFQALKVMDEDGKVTKDRLHLHSVTEMTNSGRVYSSQAPGLLMGVGNKGEYLKPYLESDLYVSDDAGLTWRLALKEAHKYELGDQGSVLVAINDEESTKTMSYSLSHGHTWETFELDDKVNAMALTTTPDSTGLKFVLVGIEGGGSDATYVIYSIDFEGLHEGECGKDDFEEWTARKDEDGNPDCLMGHTQTYRRRKPDVECFINEEFKQPESKMERCSCTAEDFECEYNFKEDSEGTCVPTASFKPSRDVCTKGSSDETFRAAAYRLIPGNTCDRSGGTNLDEEEPEFKCGATSAPTPSNGEITTTVSTFKGAGVRQKVYLERTKSSSGDDETVIMRNDLNEIYITHDQGKRWDKVTDFGDDQIWAIYPHQYDHDMVFFLTATTRVWYSVNRGKTFQSFEAKTRPANAGDVAPLSFHVEKHNWLIWVGEVDCDQTTSSKCHMNAYYSTDRGETWLALAHYCRRCEFIKREGWEGQDELVYCEQYKEEDPNGPLVLVSSNDWFGSEPTEHFHDIVAFATMSDYIIVANKDADSNLKIDASIDGQTFADARFPQNFNVPHHTAYTVLDSSTKSVFLQVTVSTYEGFEYGQLMKSNSNGTSYVSLINAVNQNGRAFVDFEKMSGLAGTALVNVVANVDEKNPAAKLLRTKITHNDGASWTLIHNVRDQTGDAFECDPRSSAEKCALHLHSYTERDDPRDTFSSPSAIGLMIGVGNVGNYLKGDDEADTFLTRDGGISWKRVRRGKYMWEYGDQGSLIVIAQDQGTTDKVSYTLDEGATWHDYVFADEAMIVQDLTTVPSDRSYQFIGWGVNSKGQLTAVNIDFSGVRSRRCELDHDAQGDDEGDYELWSPKHPKQDTDCLFGHKTTLHRKKPQAECWNDPDLDPLHSQIQENCTCTRQDFEW